MTCCHMGIRLGGWRGRGDKLRYQGDSQAEYTFSLIPFSSMGIMMTCAFTVGLKVDFYHFFLITMGEITAKHYKSGPLYQEDKSRISKSFH